MTWIFHQLKRLQYFLKHGRDDYGKFGFTELRYKGKRLVSKGIVPHHEIWTVDKNGKIIKIERINHEKTN